MTTSTAESIEINEYRPEKVRQNWQLFTKNLADDTIEKIITTAGETQKASTFNDGDENVRTSRISWMSQHYWIRSLLFNYVDFANQNAFFTHIYNRADVQFTEYHAKDGGHYDWHHDIDWNNSDGFDRKLSVTVQLSDPSEYEGGDFLFDETESPKPELAKPKGTVLVFPSYLRHTVTPVTKGVRRSLVAWFVGPQWK
tara:strand:+ start:83 stop:676 length:594 start_codon:yes stop_codon:yes gene_type:complete